jgi:hypothetical protein
MVASNSSSERPLSLIIVSSASSNLLRSSLMSFAAFMIALLTSDNTSAAEDSPAAVAAGDSSGQVLPVSDCSCSPLGVLDAFAVIEAALEQAVVTSDRAPHFDVDVREHRDQGRPCSTRAMLFGSIVVVRGFSVGEYGVRVGSNRRTSSQSNGDLLGPVFGLPGNL